MSKTYRSRDLLKMLKDDGWEVIRIKGDHHQLKHPTKKGVVTLQHPVKDLSQFVVNSIFKQAGWK